MPKIGGALDTNNIEVALADTVPVDVAQHFSINAGGDLVFTGSKMMWQNLPRNFALI